MERGYAAARVLVAPPAAARRTRGTPAAPLFRCALCRFTGHDLASCRQRKRKREAASAAERENAVLEAQRIEPG
jgi:hypothetical protein